LPASDVLAIAPIEDALEDIAAGRMVILVDDEDRENEGDLVVAADAVTPEHINFMAREGRGLICLAMTAEQADRVALEPMARMNTAPLGTAFTQSIDLAQGGGLGARGRAATIRRAIAEDARPGEFVTPGHVFPLRARPGGVLMRSGQTEGSVDLARLAGRTPAGVICEVMSEDGTMARLPRLLRFGAAHGIKVITVADLIRYRLSHERLVRVVAKARLPTRYGEFEIRSYENTVSGQVHVTLSVGTPCEDRPTLVRVHRADAVSDLFGLGFQPSRSRLTWSLERMAREGCGVLLYVRPEGDGEPLDERVRHYGALARGERAAGPSPTRMGFHDFGIGAQILADLGLNKLRVMTDSPRVYKGLKGFGLEIVEWVPIGPAGEPTPAPAGERGGELDP